MTSSTPESRPSPRTQLVMLRIFNTRAARLLLALVIVVCLSSVAATRVLYQTSIEAVVNAPRTQIEAPTDGILGDFAVEPGRTVKTGALLFQIRRDEFSRGTEDELGVRIQTARDRVTALEEQITGLRSIRDSLQTRVRGFRASWVLQLEATSAAADARSQERAQNETRVLALRGANGSTQVDVERARSDALIAAAEAASAKSALDAARRGIVTAQGAMDVPYSQQRVDELAVQITNLVAQFTLASSELREMERTTTSAVADSATDGTIPIRTNVDGVVWAAPFSKGAHVQKGTTLMTLIDCSQLYLDATINPHQQDKIEPGAQVRLRFAGSSQEFPGKVEYVRGGGLREDGQAVAQLTLDNRRNDSHAIIKVDQAAIGATPGNFCQVGRSAKVIFDGPDFSDSKKQAGSVVAGLGARVQSLINR